MSDTGTGMDPEEDGEEEVGLVWGLILRWDGWNTWVGNRTGAFIFGLNTWGWGLYWRSHLQLRWFGYMDLGMALRFIFRWGVLNT